MLEVRFIKTKDGENGDFFKKIILLDYKKWCFYEILFMEYKELGNSFNFFVQKVPSASLPFILSSFFFNIIDIIIILTL